MWRKVITVLGAVALTTPALAAPGDMSVALFLTKADALKAKGPMALFSSDMSLLKNEGMAAGAAYKSRLGQERAAGRPSSCPPAGVKVDSDKLISFLRSYPEPARPRTSMKTAIADYFSRTYPCR